MLKPSKLQKGDTVAIISLSSGLLGEPFMAEQRKLIEQRFKEYDLQLVYTPNALKGMNFNKDNPESRAEDLKWAFKNTDVKAVICAIGGDDTYRTVPFLLNDEDFINSVRNNPKIFIGYSDTTINHLMFQKIGLMTYYGHCAIVDFGELAEEMLPYSKSWFEKLFVIEPEIEITSSPVWYMERTAFGPEEFGKDRITKKEMYGFEVLTGQGIVSGELFGGCLESLSALLSGERYPDQPVINRKYELFPTKDYLEGKILFLETSEEQPTADQVREYLHNLEIYGVFESIAGVIIGKPQDEFEYEEHKQIYAEVIGKYKLPVMYNLNFGHAHPKCILPIGGRVTLNLEKRMIVLNESLIK